MSRLISGPNHGPTVPVLEGLRCLGFSQTFIAEQLKIPQPRVSRWFRGETGMLDVEVQLATALLEVAVQSAKEGQDSPELTELDKRKLAILFDTAKRWLDLQLEISQALLSERRTLLPIFNRHSLQNQKSPSQRRGVNSQKRETRTPQLAGKGTGFVSENTPQKDGASNVGV